MLSTSASHLRRQRTQEHLHHQQQMQIVSHLLPRNPSCLQPVPQQSQTVPVPTLASVAAQMNKYSSIECEYDPSFDCISFWKEHSQLLDKLYFPAIRAMSVLASSSPIQRVFSKDGLIMRPLRSKMSHSRVSELIFLN